MIRLFDEGPADLEQSWRQAEDFRAERRRAHVKLIVMYIAWVSVMAAAFLAALVLS